MLKAILQDRTKIFSASNGLGPEEESEVKATSESQESTTRSKDSDSGHGHASSSASSSSLTNENQDPDECLFVDAADEIILPLMSYPEPESDSEKSLNDFEDANQARDSIEPNENIKLTKKTTTKTTATTKPQDNSLEMRLKETTVILRMALNNEFAKALEICRSRSEGSDLYDSLASATLSFLRAALTLEPADIEDAQAAITLSHKISSAKKRYTGFFAVNIFSWRNFNSYNDEQAHAELVLAESMLLHSLISFLADQSVICLVRGALNIRCCFFRYKYCKDLLEARKNWGSEEARKHFESGVSMGFGIFNLLMSYLPRRVLYFLEMIGFSGDRVVGVRELEKSIEFNDGLRSVFSVLVILTYHSYIDNLFGLGNYDEAKVAQLNNSMITHYPNSAFFLLFRGRYHQMEGNVEAAIDSFQKCIDSQNDWKQFHALCHWEMMWCYAVQMNWPQAAHYADLLRKQSKWSPASYTYQYATFLYSQLVEEERDGLWKGKEEEFANRMLEIKEIMLEVPKLRTRYAGKTIPAEKFAITRAQKFLDQGGRLSLPALEFLYIWNVFATLKNSPQQVSQILDRINSELDYMNRAIVREGTNPKPKYDDLCLMYLLKGMCLKHLDRLDEAEELFMMVMEHKEDVKSDTFLAPHAGMEISQIKLTREDYEAAREWMKLVKTTFNGYLLETIVHFRLHAVVHKIRVDLKTRIDIETGSLNDRPLTPLEDKFYVARKDSIDPSSSDGGFTSESG